MASFPVVLGEDGRFKAFPTDGVAFGFINRSGGPAPNLIDPEPRFPLTRRSFVRGFVEPAAPRSLYRHVVANGRAFDANVWIGPRAGEGARDQIWRVVSSLRFPRLRTGQMTGPFAVLAPRSRYRMRSVTRSRTPAGWKQWFYLVRAPGGFYALGWRNWIRGGYLPCNVRFDRARFEFFCRSRGARWDRVGRVLVNPDPGRFQDTPLGLLLTKISWDGHVLVSDSFYDYPTATDYRRYWPRR